jgi:hypothetical protein
VTGSDNFIQRWARLKRASDTARNTDGSADRPLGSATDSAAAEATADATADEPFDLASLPSIEAITSNTDIRGFLQSRVPAELTRAALRQAWSSDPAIRDFIGIAENQWDFNDPNAIPGFGPLLESDNMPALLAQALGKQDKLADTILEMSASAEQSSPVATGHERADLDQVVQQTFDESRSTNDGIAGLPEDASLEGETVNNDRLTEGDGFAGKHRSHGSALPH